jgi:flagellar protein FlgJ
MAAPVNALLSNSLVQPSLPLADATGKADGARIQEVAKQLEGQFAQMLIKCMRDASFGDSLFPGENQTFRDMYDQQLAKAMTQGKGLGLAPMIARQLGGGEVPAPAATSNSYGLSEYRRMMPSEANQMLDAIAGRSGTTSEPSSEAGDSLALTLKQLTIPEPDTCEEVETVGKADPQKYARNTPERFVAEVWTHAEKAAKELGVDPRALVAQAALETGWGRRGIQRNDGGSANNLFGIKATGWKGDRVRTGTHEYTNGVKHSETAEFRAYDSPAESFADYVRLLKNSPRYQQALAAGKDIHGFAKGLQKAGYATDPSYANKIASIANGPTLGKVLSAMRSTVDSALNTAVASSAGDVLHTLRR